MIKNLKTLAILLLILLLSACVSARVSQELQQGRLHYQAGLYRQAFDELLPLATEGNKEAQYAVGYMYYNGYGVARDPDTGKFWMKKSAAQGYPPAVEAERDLRGQPKKVRRH